MFLKKELIYFIKLVLSPWRQTTRKTSLRIEKYQQCLLLQIEETEREGNQLSRSAWIFQGYQTSYQRILQILQSVFCRNQEKVYFGGSFTIVLLLKELCHGSPAHFV